MTMSWHSPNGDEPHRAFSHWEEWALKVVLVLCIVAPLAYWLVVPFEAGLHSSNGPLRAVLMVGLLYAALTCTILIGGDDMLWSGRWPKLVRWWWILGIPALLALLAICFRRDWLKLQGDDLAEERAAWTTLLGGVTLAALTRLAVLFWTLGRSERTKVPGKGGTNGLLRQSEERGDATGADETQAPQRAPDSGERCDSSARRIRAWGHFISLCTMILAMFAFGLAQGTGADGLPHVHWAEVPAILVVFVLVETGVALVARAQESREAMDQGVSRATDAAEAIGYASAQVMRTQEELKHTGAIAQISLVEVQKFLSELGGHLPKAIVAFCVATGRRSNEVTGTLGSFLLSWLPERTKGASESRVLDTGQGSLLTSLFTCYVGNSPQHGMVRRLDTGCTSCVTIGSVFADVSTQWLDSLRDYRSLDVLAITALLPTEFATPRLFRSSQGGIPPRSQQLEHFVRWVQKYCSHETNVCSYRRLTLVGSPRRADGVPGPRLVDFVPWVPAQASDACGGPLDPRQLALSLDNWFVVPGRQFDSVRHCLEAEHVDDTQVFEVLAGSDFWRSLADMSQHEQVYKDYCNRCRRAHVLPIVMPWVKGPPVIAVHPEEGGTDWLLCVPSAVIQRGIASADTWRAAASAESCAPAEDQECTVGNGLRMLQCSSVREWYCRTLHRGPDAAKWIPAWTAACHTILEDLRIEWRENGKGEGNGYEALWWPADLLLVSGSKGGRQGGEVNLEPIGALISDFGVSRPECVVKTIFDRAKLGALVNKIDIAMRSEASKSWNLPDKMQDDAGQPAAQRKQEFIDAWSAYHAEVSCSTKRSTRGGSGKKAT